MGSLQAKEKVMARPVVRCQAKGLQVLQNTNSPVEKQVAVVVTDRVDGPQDFILCQVGVPAGQAGRRLPCELPQAYPGHTAAI